MSEFPRDALCRDVDPELYFPVQADPWEPLAVPPEVSAVCARCPVRAECLAFALDTGEPWGIWAGVDPARRATFTRVRAS